MSRSWVIAAGTMALVFAGSSAVCAAERTEDPLGDAIGAAPDIVAVTFSQPEDEPRISVSIEFAEDPPLETDMETYSDVVFIHLDVDPETTQTIQFETDDDEYDYIIGTHAVQLPYFVESGGMLYETAGLSEVYENVVDVVVDGPTITWTVDRALIGDPDMISWAVLVGVEEDAEEMAYDASPNEGEPWGLYVISPEAVAATG